MQKLCPAFAALAAALLLASPALAHVNLRYPPTGLMVDFLDNARTEDICGIHPIRTGEGQSWQMPEFNTSIKTTAVAGSTLDVSWDLHYAHNGGFSLELYDAELNKIHEWADDSTSGCQVDATKQNVTIDLPAEPCPGCVLRFQRQALEWGDSYLFRSCALLNIVAAAGADDESACNGCSSHGTCAGGACTCNSSAETGFFYGTHCEYENECEADTDCGANGKCVNVGDVSGPANQCFCEAGFFGDIQTMPSGMQRRTCDRASEAFGGMDAASVAWDTFGEGYQRSLTSSADVFSGHLNPSDSTVEFAMQGKTTSWIAMGMRSVGAAAPAAGAAAEGDADTEEPAADAEAATATPPATTAPAAEGTGRRLRSRVPRILSAGRALASAEPGAGDAADDEPAATDGDVAAEGDADGAADGDADAGVSGACPNFDLETLFVPGALGAGTASNGTTEEGEDTATPAEPTRRRLMGAAVPRMPLVETEAAAVVRVVQRRRALLNAADAEPAADDEPATDDEPAADGEGAAADATDAKELDFTEPSTLEQSAAVLGDTVSGGICDGAFTTPAGQHAMVNQDVVFGAAREIDGKQYFRIVDMFTPSRSKPQPDHVFGGTDDITDAWGAEVDGVTYMKYVRAVSTEDAITDACISDDQDFHVIYAMGQLPGEYTHEPGSALETIGSENAFNKQFYQADELKFHGGGIGTTFAGRGILGEGTSLNLFEAPSASRSTGEGGCTPSTLAPEFDCQIDALNDGNVIVHVKNFVEGDTGAVFAAETPSQTGWVALGFHAGDPNSPATAQMVGATAIIATESAENGIGVFDLNAKAASGVNEAAGATTLAARRRGLLQASNIPITITDASVERSGGRTLMRFTRAFDDTFTSDGGGMPYPGLAAYHSSESTLGAAHLGRGGLGFDLAGGSAAAGEDPLVKWRRSHAALMITGWGVLLPLGVAMANTLRTYGPVWFHLHRIIQVIGLILATAGVIIAFVEFNPNDDEYTSTSEVPHYQHRALGITVMVFGWFQPLNALLRPHPAKEGEKTPILRTGWEVLHKGLGYITIILAVVTIFLGLKIGESFPPFSDAKGRDMNVDTWRRLYIGLLVAVIAVWGALLVHHFLRKRRQANKKGTPEHSSDVKAHLADQSKVDVNGAMA